MSTLTQTRYSIEKPRVPRYTAFQSSVGSDSLSEAARTRADAGRPQGATPTRLRDNSTDQGLGRSSDGGKGYLRTALRHRTEHETIQIRRKHITDKMSIQTTDGSDVLVVQYPQTTTPLRVHSFLAIRQRVLGTAESRPSRERRWPLVDDIFTDGTTSRKITDGRRVGRLCDFVQDHCSPTLWCGSR